MDDRISAVYIISEHFAISEGWNDMGPIDNQRDPSFVASAKTSVMSNSTKDRGSIAKGKILK
jgi:hypothetical protein